MKPSRGSGDKGDTGLYSGERVKKTHPRVEACGTVDELSSVLGALASHVPAGEEKLAREIKGIQSVLSAVGAVLGSTSSRRPPGSDRPWNAGADTEALERATDRIHEGLPRLTGFVIPGGHTSSSWAHLARAVCRRAERRVVAVMEETGVGTADPQLAAVAVYLNRLSDYLFCVARLCNRITGTAEELWST